MGHLKWLLSKDSQPLVQMTEGGGVSEKSDRITRRSRWMPHFWKFSKKSFQAFSSQNQTWGGGMGSEEEESEPWRGFWPKVDLGIVCSLSERERKNHS